MDRRTPLNLFTCLLLAGSILASLPVAEGQVGLTQAQLDAVKNEPGQAAGAPFGQWGRVVDKTALYLHRDARLDTASTPTGTVAVDEAYYLDYEKPKIPIVNFATAPAPVGESVIRDNSDPNDKKILLVSQTTPATATSDSAGFVIPLSLTQTADMRLYGLEVEIWAQCAGSAVVNPTTPQSSGISIVAGLEELTNNAGAWTRPDYNGGNTAGTAYSTVTMAGSPITQAPSGGQSATLRFAGSVSFGNPDLETGRVYEAPTATDPGTRFQVTFRMASTAGPVSCALHFDSKNFPSLVRLVADTSRINAWVEDRNGEFTSGLPAPGRTQADQRKFFTQVEHVSILPRLNAYGNPRNDAVNVTACSATAPLCQPSAPIVDDNTQVDYQDDFWDLTDDLDDGTPIGPGPGDVIQASDLRIRIRDLVSLALVQGTASTSIQLVSRVPNNIGDGVNRIEYTWFFPDTLPEREYRAEIFSTVNGVVPTPTVKFGLKGFAFDLLDGSEHTVNPREPTEFRMRVKNIGAEDDTVTVVPTPPGNSWTAEFVGGSTHLLKANGGEAEVVLRVTPPDTATVSPAQTITVSASSANFPNEVNPTIFPQLLKQVKVTVVSAVAHGVEITATKNLVTLQPGVDTTLAGIRVTNNGTLAETFVVQPNAPASAAGWTFQATPLSKQIAADSSSDFAVRIRAPVNAAAGQTFTLPLIASRLGDSTFTDRVDITVVVQILHGVDVAVRQGTIALRSDEICPPAGLGPADVVADIFLCGEFRDTDADRSALFHIRLTNPSAVQDSYTVTGGWSLGTVVSGKGISSLNGDDDCDGVNNVPEFWRFDFGTVPDVVNAPDRTNTVSTTYALGPNGAQDVFLELGYNDDTSSCSDGLNGNVSPAAAYRLAFRSVKDASKEKVVILGAHRTDTGDFEGRNDYSGAQRNVTIEADASDPDAKAVTQPGSKASHTLRVVNAGNEKDNLLVQVPKGTDGWTRELAFVSQVPATGSGSCSDTSPSTAPKTRWLCTGFGIYDEAVFRLNVTPTAQKPVGQNDRALVAVTSGDNGAISDSLEFLTTTVGTFQFDAQAITPLLNAEKGKTALLSFVLKNQGTSGDNLQLALIQGDSSWSPRLGLPQTNFVPAGKDLNGFISVTVPATATTAKLFRLQVTGGGGTAIDQVDFTVTPINPGALRLAGAPSNVTTIPQAGVAKAIDVVISEPGGPGRSVKVETGSLPADWDITPTENTTALTGSTEKTMRFFVTAPAGSLGNSRVPLQLKATSTTGSDVTGQANLLLQLADVFGVKLAPNGPVNQTIVPGGQVVYNMTLANLGTSTDTMRLSTSAAPAGWLIQTNPPELALGPLENRTVELLVKAPANAAPRALAATTVQAASLGSGAVSTVAVVTKVGFYEIVVTAAENGTIALGPTQTASRVYSVKNNGSVADEVVVVTPPALVNSALGPQVTFRADPAVVSLEPNQTKQVRLDITLGGAPPSGSDVTANALFSSRLAPISSPANVTLPVDIHVLRYVAMDADGDGIDEYAVDDDEVTANGYEGYLDTGVGGGKASSLADLGRFLTETARADATKSVVLADGKTVEVLDLAVDGDEDGQRDLFIDSTGDGLPDHYWDPDGAKRQDLTVLKDVDADAVPDYFVDTDGAAGLDRVYSLRQGTFTDLVEIDIDGDGTKDFLVDKNGNGQLDADETVLYSRSGRLITVQKIDMDGNEELDSVFDTDGDGVPDYFIPAGEEGAVEIVLKDVNGDGKLDWAYDADGDGRLDSYYDPATGEVGFIDAQSSFREALKRYWYIGALFGVVLALFVVLLIVTRR